MNQPDRDDPNPRAEPDWLPEYRERQRQFARERRLGDRVTAEEIEAFLPYLKPKKKPAPAPPPERTRAPEPDVPEPEMDNGLPVPEQPEPEDEPMPDLEWPDDIDDYPEQP